MREFLENMRRKQIVEENRKVQGENRDHVILTRTMTRSVIARLSDAAELIDASTQKAHREMYVVDI